MNLKDYDLAEPDPNSRVGSLLRELAWKAPYRASRLVSALEEFVWNGLDGGSRVAPERPGGAVEVFMVPSRRALAVPDAAALLRVDHSQWRIEIISVILEYDSTADALRWSELTRTASDALEVQENRK